MTQKLPAFCEGEEWCAITATAKLIGKKWHPVIVHRLLESPQGFNELKREVNGISAKVLSESLDDLREKGMVEREQINERPARVRYSLTEKGRSLEEVIVAMGDWAEKHLAAPEEQVSSG